MVKPSEVLREIIRANSGYRGFALFSSSGSIAQNMGKESRDELHNVVDLLQEVSETHQVLVPTFPIQEFADVANLDSLKSRNGIISELFRKLYPLNRTVSKFFPFTVAGPEAENLYQLRPRTVWGEGSLYEWIEKNNIAIITLGLPPYVCSIQHRAEYLMRHHIHYRNEITRSNKILIRNRLEVLTETLLVRKPGVTVDFAPIMNELYNSNQTRLMESGINYSIMSAQEKINIASQMIDADSEVFLGVH